MYMIIRIYLPDDCNIPLIWLEKKWTTGLQEKIHHRY